MAQLPITSILEYPDSKQAELRDTLAPFWGWKATIDDGNGNQIANPVSKVQFITSFIQASCDKHLNELVRNAFKQAKDLQTNNELGTV